MNRTKHSRCAKRGAALKVVVEILLGCKILSGKSVFERETSSKACALRVSLHGIVTLRFGWRVLVGSIHRSARLEQKSSQDRSSSGTKPSKRSVPLRRAAATACSGTSRRRGFGRLGRRSLPRHADTFGRVRVAKPYPNKGPRCRIFAPESARSRGPRGLPQTKGSAPPFLICLQSR